MAIFSPSVFDKAFVKAVNFLLKEGRITSQAFFAEQIKILPQTLWSILKEERGVSKNKKEYAKYILVNHYQVRAAFLETKRGGILEKPVDVDQHEHPEFLSMQGRIRDLELENASLKQQLADVRLLNETQGALIKSLQDRRKKAAGKAAI